MRRNTRYIILTTTVALCTGVSLPFLLGSSVLNTEQQSVKSEVPYCVTSPTVPSQISFAGQNVDLLRYDHRERMDRELMSFTYMHSTTMLTIKRANRYFPVIEPILKANGIPDDFKYLAVIESALNPLAKSPAGAAIIRKTKRCGFPKRKVSKIRKFQKRNVFYLFKHTKGRENQNNPFPCLLFYTFNSNRTSSLPPIRLIVLSMLFS